MSSYPCSISPEHKQYNHKVKKNVLPKLRQDLIGESRPVKVWHVSLHNWKLNPVSNLGNICQHLIVNKKMEYVTRLLFKKCIKITGKNFKWKILKYLWREIIILWLIHRIELAAIHDIQHWFHSRSHVPFSSSIKQTPSEKDRNQNDI